MISGFTTILYHCTWLLHIGLNTEVKVTCYPIHFYGCRNNNRAICQVQWLFCWPGVWHLLTNSAKQTFILDFYSGHLLSYHIYLRISHTADKSRSVFDPVILSSGICSPYKSRSSIGLKYLKIGIIVVIREKVDPVIQIHGISKCVVNINFFTGSDTHTSTHTLRERERERETYILSLIIWRYQ